MRVKNNVLLPRVPPVHVSGTFRSRVLLFVLFPSEEVLGTVLSFWAPVNVLAVEGSHIMSTRSRFIWVCCEIQSRSLKSDRKWDLPFLTLSATLSASAVAINWGLMSSCRTARTMMG